MPLWFLVLLCLFVLSPLPLLANVAIAGQTQAPIRSLMLDLQPTAAHFSPGRFWALEYDGASIFAFDEQQRYGFDYYQAEYRFQLSYSPNIRWLWRVSVGQLRSDDVGLDQLTLSFHKLFGLSQNGRDKVAKHRFYATVAESSLQLEDFSQQTLASQYRLSGYHQLWRTATQQFGGGVSLQYQRTNQPWRQGSGWDLGLQLDYGYHWREQHHFWGQVGVVRTGAQRILWQPVRTWQPTMALGYRYQIDDRHSWALQYQLSRGPLVHLGQLSQAVHEVYINYRYQRGFQQWDFILLENTINADNSADVGIGVRYQRRF